MASNTLQSLSSSSGLSRLKRGLGGVDSFYNEGPDALRAVQELVRRELESDPSLSDIKTKLTPGLHGAYFPGKDTIALGVINPAVVGHELGHAKNIRKSKVYGKLLMAANNLSRLNSTAAIPAMLAIRTLVQNRDTRNEILNILSGVSAALAAPGLAEELGASMDAVKNAPNKLQALKTLLPAFLQHSLHAAMPVGVYQVGKHI
jgi:hypothetical protein